MPETDTLLTARQTADMLSVSLRTVYNLIESGELASLKIRGARRFEVSAVEAYKASQREGGTGA